MNCPCGSEATFEKCCSPFLEGKKQPDTAEKLMRSRYTAFSQAEMDYIKNTIVPESRKKFTAGSSKEAASKAKWKGLKIVRTEAGGPEDEEGIVEFIATYEVDGQGIEHHEVSQFRKDDGQWLYVDGEAHTHREGEGHHHHEPIETVRREQAKVGRNDPCACGSGKKYKKCCG